MASRSLLRSSTRPDLYVCARCAFRAAQPPARSPKRCISTSFLKKVEAGEVKWQEQAIEVQTGKRKSMLTILEERGLIQAITGTRDAADKRLTDERLGAYVGIDPTASSLHVGHLLPFMSLFWMYFHGYQSVVLLGGATAKIGDPSDRLTTREKEHSSTRTANMVNMHYQLKKLWGNIHAYGQNYGFYEGKDFNHQRALLNNNAWWNKMPMLEVLQVLGPGMRMGPMLAKDTVKNKMEKGDGMSFAEFTYPIMQAWDWWHLYNTKGVQVQIGGADQYGNITAGIDAVKYISKNHPDPVVRSNVAPLGDPFGFTVPLLTTSSGAKFGKSAGNAIWLDRELTSTFELYGYFLRTSDADVGKYLKLFTFMPIEQIDTLVQEHQAEPSLRKAQHTLAREIVEIIAQEQHRFLFRKKPEEPAILEVEVDAASRAGYMTLNNRPNVNIQLPASVVHNLSIPRILYACGLASSTSDGTRLVQQNAAFIGGMNHKKDKVPMMDGSVNWTRVKPWAVADTAKYILHGDLLMFRKGKHNIRVIQIVPDEEYDASGKSYPGMKMKLGPLSMLDKRSQKARENLESHRGRWEGHDEPSSEDEIVALDELADDGTEFRGSR
ncbi:Tyrosine--tRNA ligase, mitochondrial [Lachnellula subtilissima]|uniref:Tyrosine--tRNA ligase n=1 Tax=Lachnellula subtilissima TaxID=602034 RepID=A0A8H8RVI8_9HELO|nr:Tyrosine--tRNA ligase, mitochondrial [Lachnellula subtilissima]